MNENDILDKLIQDFATVPLVGAEDEGAKPADIPTAPKAEQPAPTSEETSAPTAQPSEEADGLLPVFPDAKAEEAAQITLPLEADAVQPTEQETETPAAEIEPLTEADCEETEMVTIAAAEPADEIKVTAFDAPTQIIKLDGTEDEQEQEEDDPFAGQLTMEDFVEETPVEAEEEPPETEDEISWEEQLEQTRREKIRDFQIQQNRENTDFRYTDEEAPDEVPAAAAEEEPPVARTKFTGDFENFEQTADVAAELNHRYRSLRFRLWLAVAAEVLLLWSAGTALAYGGATPGSPVLFLLVNLFGFVAITALLFPMLRDGTVALVRLKPNSDSIPAVVGGTVLLHTLVQWFRLEALEMGQAPLLTAAGGMLLLLCGLGRLLRISRIRRNFDVVGKQGDKIAATLVQEERAAVEIGRRAVATGVPRVVYFRPTGFLDDFLANSYMDDRYDTVLVRYLPCAAALALIGGVVCGAVSSDFFSGFTAFVLLLCMLLPAASLALSVPLYRECKRQLKQGNMLCGYAAAERFGNVHGVALDVSDLYLSDSVALHGIRTFGATRIDEAIMDAAAVAIRTEGPLAGLFLRIIEQKTEILQPVDNLVFEQDMGFSGWVGGRRVLVGNRKLLENHGLDTPSSDYERKYKKDGRELVYLSVAGELSAMFIISYLTNETVENALHELQDAGVSLLIRSCDPNVTEESLCAGFHLDDFYVDLLSASAGRLYDNLRRGEEDRVSAGAAVRGGVAGIAELLTGCRRLRRRGIAAMLAQILCAVLAAVICFAAFLSAGTAATVLPLVLIPLCALVAIIASWF